MSQPLQSLLQPMQMGDPLAREPRLPPELFDVILAVLGRSPDRAMRNTLIPCFLVSKSFYSFARRHYFRKLTIKHFVNCHRPLPQREYHLIQLFFDNPDLLGFIQELDMLYDSTGEPSEQTHCYRDAESPVSQSAILDRFPWDGPRPQGPDALLPLYLLLRQSPIHTARFILRNSIPGSTWLTTNTNHLAPICSIPALKSLYFASMFPIPPLGLDSDPQIIAGLERLELIWVAESEEEFDDSTLPLVPPQSITSPASTERPHLPLYQVIRMNRRNIIPSMWLRPRRFFQTWFPGYKPSPALQGILAIDWVPKALLDLPDICDALDNMPNACPGIRKVTWDNSGAEGRSFFEIIIERKHY